VVNVKKGQVHLDTVRFVLPRKKKNEAQNWYSCIVILREMKLHNRMK